MSKYSKEELEQLILVDNLSYEEIGRRYEAEHFNKDRNSRYCIVCGTKLPSENKKFCSYKCQQEHLYLTYIDRWKNGLETGTVGSDQVSKRIRRYLFNKFNNECCKCHWHEVNPYSGLIPLQVHHKDGNCLNNNEENLELLCPNCHSLTENYGNLNEHSQRVR